MHIKKIFLTLFLSFVFFELIGCSKTNNNLRDTTEESNITTNKTTIVTTIETTMATTIETTTETTTEDPRPRWEREDWSNVDAKEKVSILNPNWELIDETNKFGEPTGKFKLLYKNVISSDGGTDTKLTIEMGDKPYISITGNDTLKKCDNDYDEIVNDRSRNSSIAYIHTQVQGSSGESIEIAKDILSDEEKYYSDEYATLCNYLKENKEAFKIYLEIENHSALEMMELEHEINMLQIQLGTYNPNKPRTDYIDDANVLLTLDCTNFDKIFDIWLNTIYE